MFDFSTLQRVVINNEIVSCHKYKDGAEGDVYEIDTMNGALVAKFFSSARLLRYPNTISNEILLLAFLSDNNIAAPIVYGSSNNWICYHHINGEHIIPDLKALQTVVHYLESLYSCNTRQLGFLHLLGFDTMYAELQESKSYEPIYNKILQKELVYLNWETTRPCLSHGDFHHGNMIWTNQHDHLALIDWDEARLAPIEFDISRFFVSHSIYSDMAAADDFLNRCCSKFHIQKDILSFFVHFNAYYCLIRFEKWRNCFWGNNNTRTEKETKEHLKSLIEKSLFI